MNAMNRWLLTALIALGPVAASANKPTNAELKIGITQEFENLNPLIMTMSATTYIYMMMGRSLATLTPDGKWVPQLAKTIPSLENGGAKFTADKKGLLVNWEIRDDAKWSDGKPVVCADFAFTREVGLAPTVSVGEREIYSNIKSITWDKASPQKCLFTYEKAKWDFYQMGGFRPLPKHIEEPVFKRFKKTKEGYEKNSNYTKNPRLPGLANGPYQISELKLGSHVTLVPNPHFYGPAPKIARIIIKLLPNTGTLEANLRSGTIDMISHLGLAFDQALAFEKKVASEKLPYQVVFKPSLTYEHIDLNLDNPILKDPVVRKALLMSINREELVKALFDGKQTVADHNIAPIDPWYTRDPKIVTLYPYARREAIRMLEGAGWKMGASGVREKNGQKLSFQFMTTAGNKTRETVQTFLQGQWKSVGIDVTIKNEPARVFFGDTTKKRAFPHMAMYAWVSTPEQSPRSTLHSKSIPNDSNGWSGQNYPGWVNAEVDAAIDALEVEFDPAKRITLAHTILKHYTADLPVLPLYYRSDVAVIPTNLKNFRLAGHQFADSNEVELWNLE